MRLHAALATMAVAAATGVVLAMPEASAATGGVTGYATQNGGTTSGAGGQTVRATTGTAIHAALCGRAASSTPLTIEVEGTINHGNTSKVSGTSCNTADGVIELKQISNVTIVNADTGTVLTSGSGAGVITFPRTSLNKITFEITSSTGTPKVAEYETYAG